MNKTNWGIIATGSIAAKLAEAINSNENSVLYAVASRSENKAKDFAEKFGAIKHYSSYEQLAADENVDVVYIATPMACLLYTSYKHGRIQKSEGTDKA